MILELIQNFHYSSVAGPLVKKKIISKLEIFIPDIEGLLCPKQFEYNKSDNIFHNIFQVRFF